MPQFPGPATYYFESSSVCPFAIDFSSSIKTVAINELFTIRYGWATVAASDPIDCNTEVDWAGVPNGDITFYIYGVGSDSDTTPSGPPISLDGTLATMSGSNITRVVQASTAHYIQTSIDKPGTYRFWSFVDTGGYAVNDGWEMGTISGQSIIIVTGSLGTLDTPNNITVAYNSGSTMRYKNLYPSLFFNNINNGLYENRSTSSLIPVSPSNVSVNYTASTAQVGSLSGTFTGSVFGRLHGYVYDSTSNQYTSSYYADIISGSFTGSISGSICGLINGKGNMSGTLVAGPIGLASASINGQPMTAYSGTITGTISGSITGSVLCNISQESTILEPIELVELTDDRLRLYYRERNPLTNNYSVSIIETEPIT